MKLNKTIVLCSLLLLLFLSIGMVAANENNTAVDSVVDSSGFVNADDDDDYDEDDVDERYNAKIIAEDITLEYDTYPEIPVYIVDNTDCPIKTAEPYLNGYLNAEYSFGGYYYFYPTNMDVGTHNVEIELDDGHYSAEPVTFNVKIVKSVFYGDIKCKSYYGTDKSSLTMKASIYNPDGGYYEDGYVTFNVNGKSYKVKTKNGVATKTIKIKKAGTYTYAAKFSNENYKSSLTGKGKLYVYSTSKNARTFNIGKYKIVLPVSKYNKLINAKNTNKVVCFEVKTNKYVTQTVGNPKTTSKWVLHKKNTFPYGYYYNRDDYKVKNQRKIWIDEGVYDLVADIYKKVTITKKVTKTVKARISLVISYGGKSGAQTGPAGKYCLYVTTPYQNPGYDICKPCVSGMKVSSEINKLNKAKTR